MTGPFPLVRDRWWDGEPASSLTPFPGFPRIEVRARFAQISEFYLGSTCPVLPQIDP